MSMPPGYEVAPDGTASEGMVAAVTESYVRNWAAGGGPLPIARRVPWSRGLTPQRACVRVFATQLWNIYRLCTSNRCYGTHAYSHACGAAVHAAENGKVKDSVRMWEANNDAQYRIVSSPGCISYSSHKLTAGVIYTSILSSIHGKE